MTPIAIHTALVLIICCSVVCRARHMDTTTKGLVKWQHALLGMGAWYSLVVPDEWSAVVLGAGVVAFLLLGAARWRFGAPAGTTKSPRPGPHNPWAKQ